ncbi:uncharacterized protein LOC110347408 [Heterocephalus glaber]|uniref:Uncharacterized protein LOC110347408 n=1 Tax=Heterocephalus glaber TaxID=10181 RepID=A0AAX6SI69_HETGA|nr:uncharacterized protein LOC110347408 [Heterocephalus glaber]
MEGEHGGMAPALAQEGGLLARPGDLPRTSGLDQGGSPGINRSTPRHPHRLWCQSAVHSPFVTLTAQSKPSSMKLYLPLLLAALGLCSHEGESAGGSMLSNFRNPRENFSSITKFLFTFVPANAIPCPALQDEIIKFLMSTKYLFKMSLRKFNPPEEAVAAKLLVKDCVANLSFLSRIRILKILVTSFSLCTRLLPRHSQEEGWPACPQRCSWGVCPAALLFTA